MALPPNIVVTWAVAWALFTAAQAAEPANLSKQPLYIPFPGLAANAQSNSPIGCIIKARLALPISALAFSPDSKRLAVGGHQEVLVWDLAGASLLKRIGSEKLTGFVRAVAFSRNGQLLAAGEGLPGRSGAVSVFNPETAELIARFDEPKDVVCAVAFSPDGQLLAAGGADSMVRVWNTADKKLVTTLREHGNRIGGLSFSADGRFLASAGADQAAQIWEVATWKSVLRLAQADAVHAVAFGSDDEVLALAVGGPTERAVRLRKVDYPTNLTASPRPKGRTTPVQNRALDTGVALPLDVSWNSDGSRLYVPCTDRTIKVFNPANGVLLTNLTGHGDWVYGAVLSPDGARLASGSGDGTVKLWSTADNRLLATFIQLSPRTDEWLIFTAQGHFCGSATNALDWKTADSKPPPLEWIRRLQNPEQVREAMAARKAASPRPTPEKAKP